MMITAVVKPETTQNVRCTATNMNGGRFWYCQYTSGLSTMMKITGPVGPPKEPFVLFSEDISRLNSLLRIFEIKKITVDLKIGTQKKI